MIGRILIIITILAAFAPAGNADESRIDPDTARGGNLTSQIDGVADDGGTDRDRFASDGGLGTTS